MSAIVETEGSRSSGSRLSSQARIFFGPYCGKRFRTATKRSPTAGSVACGQQDTAWLRSSNQPASPDSRRAFQT